MTKTILMKKKVLKFQKQFCDDIEMAAIIRCEFIHLKYQNALQLYDKDEDKLQYIESQRNKVREKIIKNQNIKWYPIEEITTNLTEVLKHFFNNLSMSYATSFEFSETLNSGDFQYEPKTKKLILPYDEWERNPPAFSFVDFDYFQPLIEYIKFCLLFIDLKSLAEEIKEKTIDPLQTDPSANSLQLALNVMGQTFEQIKPKPIMLSDIFESTSRYNFIMGILIKQKKCQSGSHIWIGQEKGDKSFLAALLKYLHSQGYYKNKKLTNAEIKEVCMNTFKSDISIDCVKKAKSDNFDMKIIPLASSLPL